MEECAETGDGELERRLRQEAKDRAEKPLGLSPSTESIVCWVSWDVMLRNQPMSVEPGRLFCCDTPANVDTRIHNVLQPIFSHISREDHSERAAFLHITRALIKRCSWEGTDDCHGTLKMFISHFPCISCVAIACQFVRFFPAIRLQLDFDNMWKTRYEPADKAGSDRYHLNGGLEGRRKRIENGIYDW
eukprot:TRINITY_DN39120_c0_g1_i1.p1 TRINITY_DN39120_c0_g1~~TRINITY_DN39120_c0_g1_i1.p1  ORF type:complete len:189 (+),score=30.86 TRINITY_DN39120_c0_g1_i1:122-688(+)